MTDATDPDAPRRLPPVTPKSLRRMAAAAANDTARIAINPADALGAVKFAGLSLRRTVDALRGEPDGDQATDAPDTTLRERGDALLYRSWDARAQQRRDHPAFERILGDLTPDEARVLRFLAVAGPQPALDLRSRTPFGFGSRLLVDGVNLVADMAGCAWPDRSRQYLGNLERLGLVLSSREPVTDFRRYYLLDALPEVADRDDRTTSVYRSITLTPFGTQFCDVCFTLTDYDGGGWADQDRGDHYWGRGPRLP